MPGNNILHASGSDGLDPVRMDHVAHLPERSWGDLTPQEQAHVEEVVERIHPHDGVHHASAVSVTTEVVPVSGGAEN